ncbi:MAG: TonB-dependent receptor plug domain-containing protein, partial [Bacteroidota bacterium]
MKQPNFLLFIFLTAFIAFTCQISNADAKQQNFNKADSTSVSNSSESDTVKIKAIKRAAKFFTTASMLDSNFISYKVSQNYMETTDYRFTEDFLVGSQSAFIKKLGNRGMPVEVSLYGLSSNSTSFLSDGISVTNRMTNFTNLHLIQSESIETIEVIPLPRGFLFGNSNIAAVNFILREPSANKPYSRLRYYQAPESEGLIDAAFNINPLKKLKAYVQLANHGADSYYANSRFSNWHANIRLSYLLSPTETIRLDYKHVKANSGLNGGVDLEATGKRYPNLSMEDVVYDNITAVVRFPNRYITNTNNFIAATLLTKAVTEIPAEFSLYFRDELSEFRQNISGTLSENVLPVSRDNKVQTLGARFRFDYANQLFDLVSITAFERDKYTSDVILSKPSNSSLSTSLIAALNLPGKRIIPSAFIKYFLTSQTSGFFGLGGDVLFNISEDFSLYAGAATFQKPHSYL